MNSRYRWIVVFLGACIAALAFAVESSAQTHEGFIYGKIYTNNNTYTGAIRWGGEEALWTDLFNASKTSDSYKKLVPDQKQENDSWLDFDWTLSSIWEDKIIEHQFTCQFGNLKEITVISNNRVKIKLKNGIELTLNGEGYNDVGADIQVTDPELGAVSIKWDRISKIEFLPTPLKLDAVFGTPLYGTVEGLRREKFTGFIVWDNDERLSTDKLDGDSNDGDVSLKFADIVSIQKSGKGCEVTLKSGRQFYLTGSNDVDNGNRGILIVTPDLGIVEVSWDAFRSLTLTTTKQSGQAYDQFTKARFLQGTVSSLDGEDVTGRIIFDIDETFDFEFVEGEENDIQYRILLKNIRKISPKNSDYSFIELTSGEKLLVGSLRDVSSNNGGLLVFVKGKKEPHYIPWRKINEIIFN